MIFTEPDFILDAPEKIIFVSKAKFSVTKKTAFVSEKIVSLVEKTLSLTNLIFDAL